MTGPTEAIAEMAKKRTADGLKTLNALLDTSEAGGIARAQTSLAIRMAAATPQGKIALAKFREGIDKAERYLRGSQKAVEPGERP